MRRIAIDTNVYVGFMSGTPEIVEGLRYCESIAVDVTVVGELFSGFALGTKEQKNREEFSAFANSPRVHILTHDLETAEFYAAVVLQLRRKGRPIPSNDLWIAASAMQRGLALYTRDQHFREIEGLLLYSGR